MLSQQNNVHGQYIEYMYQNHNQKWLGGNVLNYNTLNVPTVMALIPMNTANIKS